MTAAPPTPPPCPVFHDSQVIIGATSLAQLQEDLAAFDQGLELSKQTLDGIDAIEADFAHAYYTRASPELRAQDREGEL